MPTDAYHRRYARFFLESGDPARRTLAQIATDAIFQKEALDRCLTIAEATIDRLNAQVADLSRQVNQMAVQEMMRRRDAVMHPEPVPEPSPPTEGVAVYNDFPSLDGD